MSAPFLLRVHGRSGHASMPGIADNALVKAAPLSSGSRGYAAAARARPRDGGVPAPRSGTATRRRADTALELARSISPLAGELVEPLLGTTIAPTMAVASSRRNVIPSVCEITVDCRVQPGVDPERRARRGARVSRRGRLRARADRAPRRDALAARRGRCGTRSRRSSASSSRARAWRRSARGVHRLALDARRVRHRRVRLLSVAVRPRDGGAADPFGRRARAGGRPRARRGVPALHGAHRLRLDAADAGAAPRRGRVRGARGVPRGRGVLGARRRGRRPLPRVRAVRGAAPRRCAGAAGAVPAAAARLPDPPREPERASDESSLAPASASGSGPGTTTATRRRSRRCARRSRAATSTR